MMMRSPRLRRSSDFGAFLSCIRRRSSSRWPGACEELGYDSVWTGDHVSFHDPIYESLTLLASYAGDHHARSSSAPRVYLLALRPSAIAAKVTSTLDVLSGGRLIFGVGVGGENPKEFEVCGVPAPRARRARHRGHRRGAHALARHARPRSRGASPSSRA